MTNNDAYILRENTGTSGVIEIELGLGVRIRVSGRADAATLRRVLEILSRR